MVLWSDIKKYVRKDGKWRKQWDCKWYQKSCTDLVLQGCALSAPLKKDLWPRMRNLAFLVESYTSICPPPRQLLFTGKQSPIYVKAIEAGNENIFTASRKEYATPGFDGKTLPTSQVWRFCVYNVFPELPFTMAMLWTCIAGLLDQCKSHILMMSFPNMSLAQDKWTLRQVSFEIIVFTSASHQRLFLFKHIIFFIFL